MKKNIIRLLLFSVLLGGIVLAVIYRDAIDTTVIQNQIEQSGVLAPLIFMLIYILATVFFLPGSMLTLIGGALFGPVMGVFYNLTAATIGAVLAFLPRFIRQWSMNKKMIPVSELKKRLDNSEDLLLLDVRTEEDYYGEQGHIEGSLLLPLEQLEQKIPELTEQLKNNKNKVIVTICRTDRKSSKAAQLLLKHGFSHVQIVRMGMTDWIKEGYTRAE